MRIDYSNHSIINTTYLNIHDCILNSFYYDYQKKRLKMNLSTVSSAQLTEIEFFNVIGVEIVACDFWGPSPHILDWISIDRCKQTLIPKLLKEKKDNDYCYSSLNENNSFIETMIITSSGNRLLIACECIVTGSTEDGSLS